MLIDKLKKDKVVVIFRNVPQVELRGMVDLLLKQGLNIMEVTLDSPGALDSIHSLKKEYGDEIVLGAGTVTTVDAVKAAQESGAEFIISPHVDRQVIHAAKEKGLYSIPGAMTPTEIYHADSAGADMIKIFPASTLGPDYIKQLRGPFSNLSYMATGGVNEHNADAFLKSGAAVLGIGSALTKLGDKDVEAFIKKLKSIHI
ncbi:bifunctional 4-hydroxy-2-oxoglutarate aldolase/2-dehydro-3-deoxy-phosphogluconate aldolase [Bacillus sp. Marseille-Q3570]|uniref:bifunctional 4-hydroxy-2-oxoglutarate aldolase/2-dehydro-3-deoxy-phosphogluconate aldolase n=1 Tax=Bacillus sp. Marseille-Q3570 TaxID=2963522 RepID=UPI0021B82E51|nr:bifunctional 4-hydroxy-2-oxoglutarate aldolase/2-dehydro-3-deoxy-phosphogluconate aldolase [Bacillus sp. Marseille-Q3570]